MSVVPMVAQPRTDGVRMAEPDTQPASARGLAEMSVEHWNTLFLAVETRLGQAIADFANGGPRQITRTTVMECLEALIQLRGIAGDERERCERVEHELREAHAALARVSGAE